MRKQNTFALMSIFALVLGTMIISASLGQAQTTTQNATSVDDSRTFLDRDRLTEILMADEQADFDQAKEDLKKAESDLAEAEAELYRIHDRIAGLPETDAKRTELAEESVELQNLIETDLRPTANEAEIRFRETKIAYEDELAIVSIQVRDMPEDTLHAFNRSLSRAVAQGLVVDLDSEEIQAALDAAYDRRQINALTKALEEEAKFVNRARFLESKAMETGDQRYLEKADRIESRAMTQRQKFLARIDRYENINEDEIKFEGSEDLTSDGFLTAEVYNAVQSPARDIREGGQATRKDAQGTTP